MLIGGADFWEAEKRGGAIAIFALATFGGPAVGPVVRCLFDLLCAKLN